MNKIYWREKTPDKKLRNIYDNVFIAMEIESIQQILDRQIIFLQFWFIFIN